MATILAMDTATEWLSVALGNDKDIFCEEHLTPRAHDKQLLCYLQQLQRAHPKLWQSIEAIAVGVGPGSFMGVRIATAVTQALAWAQELPVISFSSLHVMAQQAYEHRACPAIIVIQDARMQQCYYGHYAYDSKSGGVRSVCDDQLLVPEACHIPQENVIMAGNAWKFFSAVLPVVAPNQHSGVEYPSARSLLTLAQAAWRRGAVAEAVAAQPVYLRQAVT